MFKIDMVPESAIGDEAVPALLTKAVFGQVVKLGLVMRQVDLLYKLLWTFITRKGNLNIFMLLNYMLLQRGVELESAFAT